MRTALAASSMASTDSFSSNGVPKSLNEEMVYSRKPMINGEGSIPKLPTEELETDAATSDTE
jgi:hypothetical protein